MKNAAIVSAVIICSTSSIIAIADDADAIKSTAKIELVGNATESSVNNEKDLETDALTNKNYLTPALEIVGFDFLLNQFNRHFSGISDYNSNLSTIRHNLRSSWDVDKDPFKINQLGHPYQG